MASFAKSTYFSAVTYAAFRPTYPPKVFSHLLNYHTGNNALLVDLGCGHGITPRQLSPHFQKIIAIDPSTSMITQARSSTPVSQYANITFRTGSAEDLSFVEDGEVDVVFAGQSAHWFDYKKVWPELAKKVKSGGTLAFVGYKDNIFVDYPAATKVFAHYCYGDSTMGPYWELPGREILRDKLVAVKPPTEEWEDVRRITYEPGLNGTGSGEGEVLWGKKLKLGEVEAYVKTFSAYATWRDAHPDVKSKVEGGEGDIVDEMFEKVVEAEPEWKGKGEEWRDIEVENEWGSVILLARRK